MTLFDLTKYNFIFCNEKWLSHNDFINAGADVCHVDHVQSEKDPITDMMLVHTASSIHKEFIPIVKLTRMLDEDDTGAQVHSWDKKGIGGGSENFTPDKGDFSGLSGSAGKAENELNLNLGIE